MNINFNLRSLWWKWFLSPKKGDLPFEILINITQNMSAIGNKSIKIGKNGLADVNVSSVNLSEYEEYIAIIDSKKPIK